MKLSLPRSGDTIAAAKHQLRSWIRTIRDSVPATAAARAATSAAERLLAHPPASSAQVVALYATIGSELDTRPLFLALRERGVALAYPRIAPRQRRLGFHRVSDLSELTTGSFGIPEPDLSAPTVPVERIDLFVVPGLAFDRDGGRLGWGKGYYDATLVLNPAALRVGFGFECQVIDAVPRAEYDAAMTHLVTEYGVRVCPRPGAPDRGG